MADHLGKANAITKGRVNVLEADSVAILRDVVRLGRGILGRGTQVGDLGDGG